MACLQRQLAVSSPSCHTSPIPLNSHCPQMKLQSTATYVYVQKFLSLIEMICVSYNPLTESESTVILWQCWAARWLTLFRRACITDWLSVTVIDIIKILYLFLRYMFFTKWGASSPMLERTALDGSNRTTLVQQKIVYPYGVTVDYPTQHVYWVDTYLDFVERIDYDGSNRRTVKKGFPVRVRKRYHCFRRFTIFSLENDLEEKLPVTFT